jgi:hypothetical protein
MVRAVSVSEQASWVDSPALRRPSRLVSSRRDHGDVDRPEHVGIIEGPADHPGLQNVLFQPGGGRLGAFDPEPAQGRDQGQQDALHRQDQHEFAAHAQ